MREIQLSLVDWLSCPRDLSRGLFAGGTGEQRILGNPGKFELVNRNNSSDLSFTRNPREGGRKTCI